jgi:CheY-like chemotaxis protein
VWVWPSVRRSWNATAAASGWNLNPNEVPPFSSRSLPRDEPGSGKAPQQPSIVLVEDNSADVNLVQVALAEHHIDHSLIILKDGEKAVQYIDDVDSGTGACPTLFILDLNLPRKDGREVLRRIRLSPRCGALPIIILSSSGAEKDRKEAKSLGATIYIRKPSDLDQFLSIGEKIKELLKPR